MVNWKKVCNGTKTQNAQNSSRSKKFVLAEMISTKQHKWTMGVQFGTMKIFQVKWDLFRTDTTRTEILVKQKPMQRSLSWQRLPAMTWTTQHFSQNFDSNLLALVWPLCWVLNLSSSLWSCVANGQINCEPGQKKLCGTLNFTHRETTSNMLSATRTLQYFANRNFQHNLSCSCLSFWTTRWKDFFVFSLNVHNLDVIKDKDQYFKHWRFSNQPVDNKLDNRRGPFECAWHV